MTAKPNHVVSVPSTKGYYTVQDYRELQSFVSDPKISNVELVLPYSYEERIRDYLFDDEGKEAICFVLCGHAITGHTLRLLGCQLAFPLPTDYRERSSAFIRLDPDFDQQLRQECKAKALSLVDIHSHPFASAHVGFSGIDDNDEVAKFHYFQRNMPECAYASVVMGRTSYDARVFLPRPKAREPQVLPMGIRRLGVPLTGTGSSDNVDSNDTRFDRQVRAFGSEGQKNLQSLRVAVVGVGGLGSLIAEGLVRLGVRNFLLIDPDRTDSTNINRLAGMRARHLLTRPFKVELISRHIRSIAPDSVVSRCASDVFSNRTWRRLRDVDLIVATTDNFASRMLLNTISNQYLIPMVSIGTLISTQNRRVDGHGHVYMYIPGQPEPCLICSGLIDIAEAYYELGPADNRRIAAERGYIEGFDEPDPAVCHLNGILANLALVEIHNLACGVVPRTTHLHYTLSERRILTIQHEETGCAVCSGNGWLFGRGDMTHPISTTFALDGLDGLLSAGQ